LALTDNLNFGNPERPEIMGQFVDCLRGIGEAASALDFPIVSGNVSLYNETQGRGILPTPSIGGVGLIDDVAKSVGVAFARDGDAIILVGDTSGWLGQSMYLWQVCGREEGAPPPVDLVAERRNGDSVRALILSGHVNACHDLSDGGLAIALAEMAMAGCIGAAIDPAPAAVPAHAYGFGEDQARYILASAPQDAQEILDALAKAGAPAVRIGSTGGDSLQLGDDAPISIAELASSHEGWLPKFMRGETTI
jgi:phosphoribosylformylglycinamidine synthase